MKKIIFQLDLSWKLASKKRLKEILKEIGKENEFWNFFFFHWIRFFYLDAFWYHDRYWKPSPGSTRNIFNNGLIIFHNMSSIFKKMWASCKFLFKNWNFNFFQNTKNPHKRLPTGSFWASRGGNRMKIKCPTRWA